MEPSETVFVGANGRVAAIEKRDGTLLWRTQLRVGLTLSGYGFVTVLVEGERVYAHTSGRLYCLDARTGEQLWTNELVGLGYDIATVAVVGTSSPSPAALLQHRRESASSSTTAGTSGGHLPGSSGA